MQRSVYSCPLIGCFPLPALRAVASRFAAFGLPGGWPLELNGTLVLDYCDPQSRAYRTDNEGINLHPLSEEIAAAARRAVTMSETRGGGQLDYSEASLDILKEMLAESAQYAAEMTSKQVKVLAQDFGAYILEVAQRRFGGRYAWLEQRDQPVLIVGEPDCRIALITWDKVSGRLAGDAGDDIPFFYAGFAERALQAKPGDDVLFVSAGTRRVRLNGIQAERPGW